MSRRRNTVHDLAALRLHPDGSRVHTTDRQSKYVTRDTRGNWIATDAGGTGTINKRRRARDFEYNEEEQEEIDIDRAVSDDEQQDEPCSSNARLRVQKGKGKAKAKAQPMKDVRARKRKRFHEDFEFIDPVRSLDWKVAGSPVPSSDLLKCIHYFASTFYSERGELFDATRAARQEKRKRKLDKEKEQARSRGETDDEEPQSDDHSSESDDTRSSTERPHSGVAKQRMRTQQPQDKPVRDMYKIFTGSALMALGMLFQEHVGQLLEPHIAPEWEHSVHEMVQDIDRPRLLLRDRKEVAEEQVRGIADLWDGLESDVDNSDDDSDFIPGPT